MTRYQIAYCTASESVRLVIPAEYTDKRWVIGQWEFEPADDRIAKSRFILPVFFVYDAMRTIGDEVTIWSERVLDFDRSALVDYANALFEVALASIWDKVQSEDAKKQAAGP